MNKRLLALLLAILMVLSTLVGCASEAPTPSEQPSTDGSANTTPPPSDDQTPPAQDQPATDEYQITKELLSQYTVVYADGRLEMAQAFCDELNRLFGTSMTPVADTAEAVEKEIVIGKANREGISELLAPRHSTDGVVSCVNGSILIAASHKLGLEKAIAMFWEKFYNADLEAIKIAEGTLEIDTEYALPKDLKFNGVDLSRYSVIYPAGADAVTVHLANALSDYFKVNGNLQLRVYADTRSAGDYEILIGSTNRAESAQARVSQLRDGQYTMFASGTKIVCHGKGFYIGSAIHEFITGYFPDTGTLSPINATGIPTERTVKTFTFPKATSVIMMIGDGMGANHIEMALAAGTLNHFYGYDLPYQTWCRTYSVSGVTDSAASATALATGYKTVNGYIGKDQSGRNVKNVSEVAKEAGARVAVLTTDSLDGATPAGFNVHNISRSNSANILAQFQNKLKNGDLIYASGSAGDGLTTNTRSVLGSLSKDNSRFFIMIEEAYTDKGSHSNDANTSNAAVARFNDTIAYAIAFVMLHPDTALIITADHETGGIVKNQDGSFSYTTGSHTNANVPYFALGGEDVAEFIATDTVLNNVWNAMFIASVYGVTEFGDPALRYK